MNQPPDIDFLVERRGLVTADWGKRLPYDATPYTTITVFMVRKGSPRAAPVAVVERRSRKVAMAFTEFLFSPQRQETITKHAFRLRNEKVSQKFADRLPATRTFNVERTLGSWAEVQKRHFSDGGIYDQIVVER
jgi:ABC-type sulfate transport system substrate-binding protein